MTRQEKETDMPGTRGFDRPVRAAVIGASGGIGRAFVEHLAAADDVAAVLALSRKGKGPEGDKVEHGTIDTDDEASIAAAAERVERATGGLDLVLVATGMLHGPNGVQPEKSWRQLSPEAMLRLYRTNTVGPALVAKHFLPLLPRQGRCIFAALSARVGSIGDNGLGGWHSYRASKAALNMLLRNFAIEVGRRNGAAVVVGLHPGTVDTSLSEPFQGGVPAGRLFTPSLAAQRMLATLDGLGGADSGGLFAYDGERLPY
jgi:NAD(P)-dependent dehydrogenase (short-subunit alcohol dehydrogenase family)